ncbi:hypothetical protein Bbelb_316080 [Branchiostoma belcheri]|nr:hypothetical protein Bbelb_316080 [Branchiostoma belcheri]
MGSCGRVAQSVARSAHTPEVAEAWRPPSCISHMVINIIHPDGGLANPVCISQNLGEEIGAAKIISLLKHHGASPDMLLAAMMPLRPFSVMAGPSMSKNDILYRSLCARADV